MTRIWLESMGTIPAGFRVNAVKTCISSDGLAVCNCTIWVTNSSASGYSPSLSLEMAAPCWGASGEETAFTNFSPCGIMVTLFRESAPLSAWMASVRVKGV